MGFREDAINHVRRRLLPGLHYLFDGTFGGYAVSHTTAEEYALTTDYPEEELEQMLEKLGFTRNTISALKVRLDGNTSDGSWVWRPSPLSSYQLHIVLHDLEGETGVDAYAHWERSWIRHPYKHYLARGYDAEKGVDITRELFDRYAGDVVEGQGVDYEIDTSIERQLSEALSLSYYHVTEQVAALRSRVPLLDDWSQRPFFDGDDGLLGEIDGPVSGDDDPDDSENESAEEGTDERETDGRPNISPRIAELG